jgi:hypothetical protein
MKITKRQLRRVIREALDPATQKALDDARKYRTKGEWRLRVSGAGETYLRPGWRTGTPVESFFGDYDDAKIYDNELEAIVDRDRIKADPANMAAGKLEVEGASFEDDLGEAT